MELYLDVKPIGKGDKGRTACGSAAYRSCDKIVGADGRTHNYQNKKGHVVGGILLPVGAPSELRNPQTLWQRHDAKEVRKDAQIFREIVMALPNELPDSDCVDVIEELLAPLVEMGMCAQYDLHNAHPKLSGEAKEEEKNNEQPENKHAHVMLSMRDLLPDGTFGKKNRSWNRYNGGLNMADVLRPMAAQLMNEKLELLGVEKRVEHLSYAERGIDKIPQIHVGVAGTNMAREGRPSYRQAMREVIKKLNEENLSMVERQTRLHEARQALANVGVEGTRKPSLFEQISANEDIGAVSIEKEREDIKFCYKNIREFNQKIYDLRKEKKQTDKYREALYAYYHLAGDANLTDEQKDKLDWATGYLKFALQVEKLPPEAGIKVLIDQAQERNTERCLGIYAAEKGKRQQLQNIEISKQNIALIKDPSKFMIEPDF